MPHTFAMLFIGLLIAGGVAFTIKLLLGSRKQKLNTRKDTEETELLRRENRQLKERVQSLEETIAEVDIDFLQINPADSAK